MRFMDYIRANQPALTKRALVVVGTIGGIVLAGLLGKGAKEDVNDEDILVEEGYAEPQTYDTPID